MKFPALRNVKYQQGRGAYCPSPMLLFYIPLCRKTFPAWRNVIYQHGRGKLCSGTNSVFSHSQNCNFPDESFVLSTFSNSVGSESGQKESVNLLQNMFYNTTPHPPHPPKYLLTLGRGSGVREVREKVEGQQFTRGVENTNLTDWISSL